MNRIGLFLFLVGSLFIFIGISKLQTLKEVKSINQTPAPISSVQDIENRSSVFVTKIVDGDTIDIQIEGRRDVVRLIGINAPEKNECFGKEATDKASSLLSSRSINLEADSTQDDRDKYQRLLRYVFIDGANFDELMVREGFAKEYTYRTAYKYQSLFKEAEREAQENNRGLWSFCK